ncbi:MAG TPA: glycosyltransferase family 2 protein [Chryseosolibacter sp.]|nr:glycosyltransferase family 2 protein [Chryseosolibacter sp.]
MSDFVSILFWTGIIVVFYTYIGYGIVIYLISLVHKHRRIVEPTKELPHVTLIVAAYNEEQFIADKISNTLSLDYPPHKLSIFFVTDGSTDKTAEIISGYSSIKLFHEAGRNGKIHAVNRVMKHVTTPIVIFSDANTFLNPAAIQNIVRHYEDPKVGGVAGEKRIFKKAEDNASGAGEGLYWKYESFLKQKDSDVNSVVGAAGELFSVRTDLYEPPAENIIIEDFYLSLSIAARGYRFIYEPEAFAMETASASVAEEWKRKVRISAGGFQAMIKLRQLLNPFRFGMLSFQYISHRVLRWTLAPLFLPIIFFSNISLAWSDHWIYSLTLFGQVGFYLLALAGYVNRERKISVKGFFVPYYFCVMNLSVYAGLRRYINGNQSVVWEKSRRAAITA